MSPMIKDSNAMIIIKISRIRATYNSGVLGCKRNTKPVISKPKIISPTTIIAIVVSFRLGVSIAAEDLSVRSIGSTGFVVGFSIAK
jgi:hypothetical protein